MNKVKEFVYKKANGDVSERKIWVLNPISEMMLGLDLSEFSEDEQAEYITQLQLMDADIRDAITDMGLNSQYRNFKAEGIIE